MNKIYLAAGAALVLFAGVGVGATISHITPVPSDKVALVQVSPTVNTVPAHQAEDVEGSNEQETVSLIEVGNPFSAEGTSTRFVTTDDDTFASLQSVTPINMDGNSLVLPHDFAMVGADLTNLSSTGPVVISYQYSFARDAAITWNAHDVGTTTTRWNDHPDQIFVKAGDAVLVTYTSTDKGMSWVGDIVV